jgi:hypothetical protein
LTGEMLAMVDSERDRVERTLTRLLWCLMASLKN